MTDVAVLREYARVFHALHDRSRLLVLPNAWDVATARLVEQAGFPAIATSSAAIAWSLGHADGERVSCEVMLAVAARIARAVRVPVSADLEAGYGDVATTVTAAIEAGVVGMNLEDGTGEPASPLVELAVAVERIRLARAAADRAGVRFFVNARTDVFLRRVGEESTRLARAVERGRAYTDAGADGVFVPGVEDAETIGALARGIHAPLNVLARTSTPGVAELGRLGVARVSLGSGTAAVALTALRAAAVGLRDQGTFTCLEGAMTFAEVNGLFGP